MPKIIAHASLVNTDNASTRTYNVHIYLHSDGTVRGSTVFQRKLGGSAMPGVELKCTFNANDAIRDRLLEGWAAKIAHEANRIIDKKIKAGFGFRAGSSIHPVEIIKTLLQECKVRAEEVSSVDKGHTGKDESISVEIIGMISGVAKIATVLPDFSYNVIGEIKIASRISVKIGDFVKVQRMGDAWQLV